MIEPLRIIKTRPQLTALIPITVPREDIRKVMGPGLAELKAAIAAQNVAVTGPWFTHHVRNPGEVFDFEICLPVATAVAAGKSRKTRAVVRDEDRPDHLSRRLRSLGGAWGEFIGMIKAAGHRTVDGLYEILRGRPGGER